MKINISGSAPNTCIRLQAETEAERDQISRLKREAFSQAADMLPRDVDVLVVRLENLPAK